jgi:hypothetical protein
MYNSVCDPSLNQVGYIEDGIVHDRDGKEVGYVQHNDIYRGTPLNGQLVYSIDPRASAKPEGAAFYKLTPQSASSVHSAHWLPQADGHYVQSLSIHRPWTREADRSR